MIKKYFPIVRINFDLTDIRHQVRLQAKRLVAERKQKKIKECIRKRYKDFKDNMAMHLDNILERMQIIDTSFAQVSNLCMTDSSEVKDHFRKYYQDLSTSNNNAMTDTTFGVMKNSDDVRITQEITIEEFMIALNHLTKGKAAGISGIKAEMLALSPFEIQEWLLGSFNSWLKTQIIPRKFLRSQI